MTKLRLFVKLEPFLIIFIICLMIINFIPNDYLSEKLKIKQKFVLYECNDGSCSGWADRVKGKIILFHFV